MDEIVRSVQGNYDKAAIVRLSPLSLRMGVGGSSKLKTIRTMPKHGNLRDEGNIFMAKVIDFYIPASFQKRVTSVPDSQRGKLIEFSPPAKKSA